MELHHYDLNRTFHLGRQGVFFEKIAELARSDFSGLSPSEWIEKVDTMLFYLEGAMEHASMAGKAGNPDPIETAFTHFLRALLHRLTALNALMRCALEAEDTQHPLFNMLSQQDPPAEWAILDYMNFGRNILKEILFLFDVAGGQLQAMRKDQIANLAPEEQERYEKAQDSLRKTLATDNTRPVRASGQSAYPIP